MQDFYDAGLTNSVRTKSRIDLASMGTELVYSNFAPSPKIPTTTKEVLLKHADNRQQARILAACLPDSLVLEFKGTKRSYQRLDAAERAKGEIVREFAVNRTLRGEGTLIQGRNSSRSPIPPI